MPPADPFDFNELLLCRVNHDIRPFVRAAVRRKMDRDKILAYLQIITGTPTATEKMWRLTAIAQEKALSRNEILVWLHISSGGLREPQHLSQKLQIRLCCAEAALAALKEKGLL